MNWGIASVGLISHDFVTAISEKPERHKVVAVAARSEDRAKEFADKHSISTYYGSYKELASDPDVQVRIHIYFRDTYISIRNIACYKDCLCGVRWHYSQGDRPDDDPRW